MLKEIREKAQILEELLKKYNRIGIITHKNADPDALASVIGLKEIILQKTRTSLIVIFPEGLNSLSKRIVSSLEIDITSSDEVNEADLYIIADTSSSTQLGKYSENILKKDIVIIDHHEGGDLGEKTLLEIKTSMVSSTSEIVYAIGVDLGITFSTRVLELLLSGIVFDSKRFLIAKPITFRIVADIVDSGVDYSKIIQLFNIRPDISERIARLKASMRAKHYRVKNVIVSLTEVGAFEASVARSLLELGSDVVFVANQVDKNEVRLTARASSYFIEETGIHLGRDLLSRLSNYFGGSGGGHDAAGGYTGYNVGAWELLGKVFELLIELLEERKYASRREVKEITQD